MRLVLVDFRHPFFRSKTRRIVVFVLVALWTGVEYLAGSYGWMVLFALLSAYIGWGFFLSGQPDEPLPEDTENDPAQSDAPPAADDPK